MFVGEHDIGQKLMYSNVFGIMIRKNFTHAMLTFTRLIFFSVYA